MLDNCHAVITDLLLSSQTDLVENRQFAQYYLCAEAKFKESCFPTSSSRRYCFDVRSLIQLTYRRFAESCMLKFSTSNNNDNNNNNNIQQALIRSSLPECDYCVSFKVCLIAYNVLVVAVVVVFVILSES
ncbi:unnamed protein product [Trichobilharzia regenti]|nr:unnamed protein product [Trichobilharzia regenti]